MLSETAKNILNAYEDRMYETIDELSTCPFCGGDLIVIHRYDSSYEQPDEYRIEHVDERAAATDDCFLMFYAFKSKEEAVKHANMRDGRFKKKDI